MQLTAAGNEEFWNRHLKVERKRERPSLEKRNCCCEKKSALLRDIANLIRRKGQKVRRARAWQAQSGEERRRILNGNPGVGRNCTWASFGQGTDFIKQSQTREVFQNIFY